MEAAAQLLPARLLALLARAAGQLEALAVSVVLDRRLRERLLCRGWRRRIPSWQSRAVMVMLEPSAELGNSPHG